VQPGFVASQTFAIALEESEVLICPFPIEHSATKQLVFGSHLIEFMSQV
jgi:hypothetical protein